MKYFYYLFATILILQSCKSTISVPNKSMVYPNGFTADLTKAGVSPAKEGDDLRDYIQLNYIPQIRRKANNSQRVLSKTGAVVTAVGVLGTGISGFLTKNNQQKGLTFTMSAVVTSLGVFQVFSGGNQDYKNFLSDLERTITTWEISIKDKASYNTLRSSIGEILAKYGDLYVEAPAGGKT